MLLAAATGQSTNTPSCSVSAGPVPGSCPVSMGWASTIPASQCEHLTIHCVPPQNSSVAINDLGITYGYQTPPTGTTPKGTIVFFSPEGGNMPADQEPSCPQPPCYSELNYFADYLAASYQVVQTAWDSTSAWEDTGTSTKNIAYAAGRVSAFLAYVQTNSNLFAYVQGSNAKAGMCAQGNSGGGGAIAYYPAWYNGYLDHAEFLSSPPFGNIEAGCEYSLGTVYDVTVCPTGEFGCNPANNPQSWTLEAFYDDALKGMRAWSDESSQSSWECRPPIAQNTNATANQDWNNMSIADGTVGQFNYPQTSMTAWLCSSVWSSDGLNDGAMNNSSTQAELFFQNFTSASQANSLLINGVTACNGVEDVTNAVPKQLGLIEQDMEGKCTSHH
jgi:hypothetical protein